MKPQRIILPTLLAGALTLGYNAMADETADTLKALRDQINALEQKVRVLERKKEIEDEASTEKAKTTPVVSMGANGISFRSADTNFVMKIKGMVQADSRTFFGVPRSASADAFLLRRARIILEGTFFNDFDYQIVPEFGGGATTLLDANLTYRLLPEAQIKVGKFKSPVGLEMLQSDATMFFTERALPTDLVPNRDIGAQLQGEVAGGLFTYSAGAFNGVGDRNSNTSNTELDANTEFAGRVFVNPFLKTKINFLKGFGVGLGASVGNEEGASAVPTYVTDGQQTFFSYNAGVVANGEHLRWSPQGYFYYGPFGLLGEYVVSQQALRSAGGVNQTFRNTAWQVAASYVLTGENASYKGVQPRKPFSLHGGGWGAWELTARYASLDVDRDAFTGNVFATGTGATASARGAAAWTVGVNWWLNRVVRASIDYSQTSFEGGGSLVTRQDENVLFTRVQLNF